MVKVITFSFRWKVILVMMGERVGADFCSWCHGERRGYLSDALGGMVSKKRRDTLQNIILQVLKKMDSQKNKRGILHARWVVQEEVCKKYMEYFGMVGYNPERMSDNIDDHPEWEDNPRFNDFFLVERSTDVRGTPYVFLRNASSFSEAFFDALMNLAGKKLVKVDMSYERNRVGCCGATDTKGEDFVPGLHALKDIQKIGLAEDR